MQANDAAKNFRSMVGKRTKDEVLSVWTGSEKLYDLSGKFNQDVSDEMMEGM